MILVVVLSVERVVLVVRAIGMFVVVAFRVAVALVGGGVFCFGVVVGLGSLVNVGAE